MSRLRLAALGAALITLVLAAPAAAATAPATGRLWGYGNLTAMVTPNFGYAVMPGMRYEFDRSPGGSKGHYFDELFTGPVASLRLGDVTIKGALWYYFTAYPSTPGRDTYQHNIELIPSVEYRVARFKFVERVILHNTVYASTYSTIADRNGFGTVLRNLVLVRYALTDELGAVAAIEPFFGIVNDASGAPKNDGYWDHGLRLNRVYLGFEWQATPELAVAPQYVLEHSWGATGSTLAGTNHYAYVTVSYLWKLY